MSMSKLEKYKLSKDFYFPGLKGAGITWHEGYNTCRTVGLYGNQVFPEGKY